MADLNTEDSRIEISGEVAEWQELLNGTHIVTLEGRSDDGAWEFAGGLTWNVRTGASEGDVTLTRRDGAELFATLVRGEVVEIEGREVEEADHRLRLDYEIDGGSGAFEAAHGGIEAEGALARSGARLRLTIRLDERGGRS